jgi:hypothetical protein
MGALETALIYFGSFLVLAIIARLAVARWMSRRDLDPSPVRAQMGLPAAGAGCLCWASGATKARIDRAFVLASLNERGAGGGEIRHPGPYPRRPRRGVLCLCGEPPIEL